MTAVIRNLRRAATSVGRDGLGVTAQKLRAMIGDAAFDYRYGVETRAWYDLDDAAVVGEHRANAVKYQPTRVAALRDLFAALRPHMRAADVFLDLGCGKGRTLLLAAQAGFHAARGVEFVGELCTVAERNCAAFKRQAAVGTEFRITHADAALYPIAADETVLFMFNPFDDVVMAKVHANLHASLVRHPRRMLVVYHLPSGARHRTPAGMRRLLSFTRAGGEYLAFTNDGLVPARTDATGH